MLKDPITQMAALKAENPRAVIMTGKETTPRVAMMKVPVPCGGKPMSKERCPHPIFGDQKMRKAIACYGMNRDGIVEITFRGQATPWLGIIPPGTMDTVIKDQMARIDVTANIKLVDKVS